MRRKIQKNSALSHFLYFLFDSHTSLFFQLQFKANMKTEFPNSNDLFK